jgi:hypothetical protein
MNYMPQTGEDTAPSYYTMGLFAGDAGSICEKMA